MGRLLVFSKTKHKLIEFEGRPTLLSLLRDNGGQVHADCGGRGKCGKCLVLAEGELSEPDDIERQYIKDGYRLACRAKVIGDAAVMLDDEEVEIRTDGVTSVTDIDEEDGFGVAVDLGTTTVAAALYDLKTGSCMGKKACLNPQISYAADVMGRIEASLKGEAESLKDKAQSAVNGLIGELCNEAGIPREKVKKGIMAGNTAMMYLICGYDPYILSRAPFSPVREFNEALEIGETEFTFPSVADAFVGSDTTAAIYASALTEEDKTALLCDIGTNGEIALWHNGKLYTASTAAGPAFEGAGISCGCQSVPGAIYKAEYEEGVIRAFTVGAKTPCGICGSGIIDALAAFIEAGLLDESGCAEEELRIGGITVTNDDVREIQLAKAAIAAGVHTLCDIAKITPDDIKKLCVAGAFGSGIDMENAAKIGLFPKGLTENAVVIGNGALSGAAAMLLSKKALAKANENIKKAIPCQLGGNARFNKHYIEHITFENNWS